jgi:hypothetical protein
MGLFVVDEPFVFHLLRNKALSQACKLDMIKRGPKSKRYALFEWLTLP